jgi:ABC-type nickel/cobalt efflux system permease component RcnA
MWFSSPAGSGVPKLLGVLVQAIEGVLPWQTCSKVSVLILFFIFYFIYEGVLFWQTFSKVSAMVLLREKVTLESTHIESTLNTHTHTHTHTHTRTHTHTHTHREYSLRESSHFRVLT